MTDLQRILLDDGAGNIMTFNQIVAAIIAGALAPPVQRPTEKEVG